MMKPEPTPEHQWLQKFVGNWTYETECPAQPGQPPTKFTGSETGRSIGGLWIMSEGRGQMPDGSPATMMLTLGFDPVRKRFVGTWIGSMMTQLWIYEGSLDAAGTTLTLDTTGPKMGPDGSLDKENRTSRYHDIHEMVSRDHRVLRSRMQGDDGQWVQFMECHYRRSS